MKCQLFLLHFAGGSKYSFQSLISKLNSEYITESLELPGRGKRYNEQLLYDIDEIIQDLVQQIKNKITKSQYIIYGHSMGALTSYLLCHKLKELGIQLPLKLVVSGKNAPAIEREKKISYLPDNLFWEEVIKMGGIPDELQSHPELMDFYLPILKADFRAIENYIHIKKEKLDLPIDVFYGTEEKILENEILEWKKESNHEVEIKPLPGNHFFIFSNEPFFIDYFKNLTKNLIHQQTNA